VKILKDFIAKEKNHFQRLDTEAQKLLTSIALFSIIGPIFSIFINAFIWRQSQEFMLVSFYNIMVFAAIPLGFYLNGLLLRRIQPNILYFLGLLLSGLVIVVLIYLPSLDYISVGIFGFIHGITAGMYWANRNLLTLKTTTSENRIYFSGLESILSTYSKIIVPLVIGWFIVLGSTTNLYSEVTGYKIVAFVMLIIIGFTGVLMLNFRIKTIPYRQLLLKQASPSWQKFRLLQIILGFLQAVATLLPTLMVLTLLGKEETLGTVQALSSILTAFVVYKLAKSLKVKHRLLLLQISFVLGLIGAIAFSISYSGLGVLIFYACQAIATPFLWIATSSLNYDLIDEDKNDKTHYAYITDQELYLNGGRVAAIIVFVILIQVFSNDFALRFTPLIFAISQIFLSILASSIEKKK
jgi:MFS transporter, YQGE family, putative transporter